jgi:hypothetical protein
MAGGVDPQLFATRRCSYARPARRLGSARREITHTSTAAHRLPGSEFRSPRPGSVGREALQRWRHMARCSSRALVLAEEELDRPRGFLWSRSLVVRVCGVVGLARAAGQRVGARWLNRTPRWRRAGDRESRGHESVGAPWRTAAASASSRTRARATTLKIASRSGQSSFPW